MNKSLEHELYNSEIDLKRLEYLSETDLKRLEYLYGKSVTSIQTKDELQKDILKLKGRIELLKELIKWETENE